VATPGTPTFRWVKGHPDTTMIECHWTRPEPFKFATSVQVWRSEAGAAFALLHEYGDEFTEYHYDYTVSNNVEYGYKVRYMGGSDAGAFSGSGYLTLFLDEGTDTIELDESTADQDETGDVASDTITLDESTSGIGAASDSTADTIVLMDDAGDIFTLTLETDYGYYLGDFSGKVYYESDEYGSDNGTAINAYWLSKETDFSDIDEDAISNFKTVYKARLFYVDHTAGQTVTVSVSNDGGTTWTEVGRNIGTGDGTTKSADFFFIKTGDTFQFRVEHDNTEGKFQWLNLEVFYSVGGQYFEI
jgi:hypothetical protein